MSKKNLVVVISPDGEVSVAAEGIKGKACAPLVSEFAELFGDSGEARHTSDYYLASPQEAGEEAASVNRNCS